jgi:hypothetical protein
VTFLFISDDLLLRSIAVFEFNVQGVWTQALLMTALEEGQVSLAEYADSMVVLMQWGCTFTSVSSDLLLHLAREGKPNSEQRFTSAARSLRLSTNHLASCSRLSWVFLKSWLTVRCPCNARNG